MLSFSLVISSLRPKNFHPGGFCENVWGCQVFLTICCLLKCSHIVMGLKCKNFVVRKYVIVILYFHCVCQKNLS